MNEYYGGGNITPEAANMYFAMRNLGYESTAAIADLVDNSIDAGASKIWISVDSNLKNVFIADNGTGMSRDTLRIALTLGGKKKHDENNELGKYGLGLITASLSMGRVIRIVTKCDGIYTTGVFNYEKVQNSNRFDADFYDSTESEKRAFDFRTESAESGTVLVVDDCDKIEYSNSSDFVKELEKSISEVFRVYLNKGNTIIIDGEEVRIIDPMFSSLNGIKYLVDNDIEVQLPNGETGNIHVKAVQIPDQGTKINKSLGLNIQRQGFYILRNNREIAAALEFPEIFKRHNDFNLLRFELHFNAELDDMMGINIKKHDVVPKQEIINALKTVLDEPIKKYRAEIKEKQKKKKNPFTAPAQSTTSTSTQPAQQSPVVTVPQVDINPVGASTPVDYSYSFLTYAGNEDDALFKVSIQEDKISIRYNMCNSYYSKNILGGDSGGAVKDNLDHMIEASLKAYIEMFGTNSLGDYVDKIADHLTNEE